MKPVFFKSRSAFAKWLDKYHNKVTELWVGFHKKASGKPSVTYPEALDEALCIGWIDGIRKSVDDVSYTIRFTPRKRRSNWSAVNIKRVGWLMERELMKPPGIDAFEARDPARSELYSYENRAVDLHAAYDKRFRANKSAWQFFENQSPSYQRIMTYWVMSARQDETRIRRLTSLIAASERGVRIR